MSDMHDPYEDQLAAARYRAERDQARQELAKLKDRSRDTTVSAYDLLPKEDREALRWVRGHGGLDEVRRDFQDAYNRRSELCAALGIDLDTGWSDAMAELDRRLMPEGMEWLVEAWPRFEDSKPVRFSDDFKCFGGKSEVNAVSMYEDGSFALNLRAYSKGERVKRPAVSAADGDGCCDPGTYRCQEVAFTCDSCGHTVFVDKCMVDEIRYLRAKGIRTLNCCCGHGEKVEPFIIVNEGDECRMLNMGYERRVNKHGVTYFMPKSACPPKFIAADGRPLREGDTVWDTNGDELVIGALEDGGHTVTCRYVDVGDAIPVHGMWSPSNLTHQRPVADTWERLEEDAGKITCDYFGQSRQGHWCGECPHYPSKCSFDKARDLVRRAKALAERGQ